MSTLKFQGNKAGFIFDERTGTISKIELNDGIRKFTILADPIYATSIKDELTDIKVTNYPDKVTIALQYESENHRTTAEFEYFHRDYIICSFTIETLADSQVGSIEVGIHIKNDPVFTNIYQIKHINKSDERRYARATSVVFSSDDRPVTNSIDFLLEYVKDGKKIYRDTDKGKFIGWELTDPALAKKGGIYTNRWCLHLSGINNGQNRVRGQRIYHWYGHYPPLPTLEMIEEMAEYGCSILILHMPSFRWIDGSIPLDEDSFINTINKAHELGIKMMFYMQPLLISRISDKHSALEDCLNDNGKLCWHSLKDTQIVFYEPNSDYDCDELCLRCHPAYEYIRDSVLHCYRKYGFDGLYIDFAWPSIAVCTDNRHGHKSGLFGFYDYFGMIRDLRKAIGPEAIMIGHGGSLLVSSDYAEGFDACLTGEGQMDLLPDSIGVQTGTAPTLWTMHRRKERKFRSKESVGTIIREGITPHIGLGILGKSIKATLDPAHIPHFLALWQMWRAFPVHRSVFYNYLTEQVLQMDNEEMTYSFYVTPKKHALLIVCNAGGPVSESAVSVEANIQIDIQKLALPQVMKSWWMRGSSYETFRITKGLDMNDGKIRIPEIGIDEFIGIVLSESEPPIELKELEKHLNNRFNRIADINKRKMTRLKYTDRILADFNKTKSESLSESDFMKDRIME